MKVDYHKLAKDYARYSQIHQFESISRDITYAKTN